MRKHTRQTGESQLLMVLFIVLLAFGVLMATKLVPEYIEFYQIKKICKSVVDDREIERTQQSFRTAIQKRLMNNAISGFNFDEDIILDLDSEPELLIINYHSEKPFFANIRLTVHFEHEFELD